MQKNPREVCTDPKFHSVLKIYKKGIENSSKNEKNGKEGFSDSKSLPSFISEVIFPTAWRRPMVPQAFPTVCFIK